MSTPEKIVEGLWDCAKGLDDASDKELLWSAAMCIQHFLVEQDVRRDVATEVTRKRRRKEKRQQIVGGLLGLALGTVLCLCGYDFATWQFWVIIAISCGHIVNMGW